MGSHLGGPKDANWGLDEEKTGLMSSFACRREEETPLFEAQKKKKREKKGGKGAQ